MKIEQIEELTGKTRNEVEELLQEDGFLKLDLTER